MTLGCGADSRRALTSLAVSGEGSEPPYRACAFRNATQRRFVASMIALRPAALNVRFFRVRVPGEGAPACFLAAAHLFR